ncbi:hypothetical protein UFOVP189_42 [uncultured Caudovirales phage]|uniref:Uncharacterized protein n=1 Tax=uncultured Caudovirales phage TaxID=2100421 RepID=A0A6J7WG89_9CAUD|nr:hypothetical protein UFOVP189_42 [uncultured Caudovirales phage]
MEREALKLALEALKWSKPRKGAEITHSEAITAIKAALAQPAQEPHARDAVTWMPDTGYVFAHPKEPAQEPERETLKLALEPVKCAVRDCQNHMHEGLFVGSICFPCYTAPPQREWNAALDEAAARIGEIKGFGQATQDSFAVFIKGLKR